MERPKNDDIQVLPGEDIIIHPTNVLTGQMIQKANIKGSTIEKTERWRLRVLVYDVDIDINKRHSKCHRTQICVLT